MVNVAFLAHRRSEVTVLGGVLHELVRRGHEIIAVDRRYQQKHEEDAIDFEALRREWPTIRILRAIPERAIGLASAGTRFVTEPTIVVDYCWDILFQREGRMTFATPYQQDICAREGPIVGMPALAWEGRSLNRTDFVFFIPKIRHMYQIAIVWLLAWAARRFAHRQGFRLVGVTRKKHGRTGVPFMDTWFRSDRLWPSSAQQALRSAAMALHMQSGVEFECASMGIPAYRVAWPMASTLTPDQRNVMQSKRAHLIPGEPWPRIVQRLVRGESPIPRASDFEQWYLGPRDVHRRVADYCEEVACAS